MAPSRPSGRAARAAWASESAFKLRGRISVVGDRSFTVVGHADEADDDVEVEIPLDFVAPSQRPLVRVGTQVTWTVRRYRRDEERTRSDSTLTLVAATPLSDAELRAVARRAEAYRGLFERFPPRPDDAP